MKFTLMSYHYLRYPIRKYLDKMERVGLDGIDIYCTGPQLNPFDYSLGALIQLNRDIRDRHLTPYVLTAENCVYPVNLATSDLLTWESTQRYYQRLIDTAQFLECPHIQICPGTGYYDADKDEAWKRQVEAVQLLAEYAKKKGVTIFMETCKITTTNLVVTSKELKQFIDDVGADNLLGLSDTDQMSQAGEVGEKARLICHTQSEPVLESTSQVSFTNYIGELKSVTVERAGSVRALVKLEGVHKSPNGREWLPFVFR